MTAVFPTPFPQFGPIYGGDLNVLLSNPKLSTEDAITAKAGGGQTNAYQLSATINRISVAASAGDSIKLPPATPGQEITIINSGANSIQVYGRTVATINGVAAATGVPQAAGAVVTYNCPLTATWYSDSGGDGSYTGTFDGVLGGNTPAAATVTTLVSTGYAERSVGNALTAVGTNQATALVIAKDINNITTAAASTGAVLPAAVVGMQIVIFNAGANAIKVYGNGSDTIDTVAGATGVTLTNTKRAIYYCVAAATWISAQLGVVSA